MITLEVKPQTSIFSRHFTDPGELAHSVRDAGIDYLPLDAGRYDACLTVLQVGGLHIQKVADQAHIVRGSVDASRAGLLFSLRHLTAPVINGCQVDNGKMLVLAPGREIHGLCPAHLEWASFSFPAELVERLFDLGRLRVSLSSIGAAFSVPPQTASLLARTAAEITDLAQRMVEQGATTMPVASLKEGLMELCIEAFSRGEENPVGGRAMGNAIRLINMAEEFLRANISRPIYTDELCKELAVSTRKLHQAFIDTCGMSPHAYLKRRRLMMVHHALKLGGAKAPLVKSVALAHGFWHLGNFAHD